VLFNRRYFFVAPIFRIIFIDTHSLPV
jgi:hypothetical protein